VTRVLFVCVANSGRSVMAERSFRAAAGERHEARSVGSDPGAAPHPQVVEALQEIGIDASDHVPRRLDVEALEWADLAVSTCGEEVCPVTPGVKRISWELPDPKNLPLEQVGPSSTGSRPSRRADVAGAADGRRQSWRLAFNLSVTAAVGGVLFVLVGALLAAWITFAGGFVCAAAAAILLHRRGDRSPRPR